MPKAKSRSVPDELGEFFKRIDDRCLCKIRILASDGTETECGTRITAHKSAMTKHMRTMHTKVHDKYLENLKAQADRSAQRQQRLFPRTEPVTVNIDEPQPGTSSASTSASAQTSAQTSGQPSPQESRSSVTSAKSRARSRSSSRQSNTMDSYVKRDRVSVQLTMSQLENACLELVTVNGRPFSLINDTGFRKIIDPILSALPGNPSLSAAKVSDLIHEKANELREQIKLRFKSRLLCVKLDAVSRLNRKFIGVNLQEIVEDKISIVCLGVIECPESHSGEYLADEVIKVLATFDFSVEQIYTCTVDNGRNMLKMGNILDKEVFDLLNIQYEANNAEFNEENVDVLEDNEDELRCDDDLMTTLNSACTTLTLRSPQLHDCVNTVNCAEHTLQLAVTDSITETIDDKNEPQDQNIVKKVRTIIKKLRTPNFGPKLKRCNLKRPKIDVAPRWATTEKMFKSCLEYKDFCHEHEEEYPELHLGDEDWIEVDNIAAALLPARVATDRLQAEQLTIGDMYKTWHTCVLGTEMIDHPLAKTLVKKMKERSSTIFMNKIICAGLYLDPRYQCVLKPTQVKLAVEHLISLSVRLRNLQQSTQSESDAGSSGQDELEQEKEVNPDSADSRFKKQVEEQQKKHLQKKQKKRAKSPTKLKAIVTNYTPEKTYPPEYNVFKYWMEQQDKLPQLYELATVVLGVPSTQVSVERLFSGLKFVLSTLRFNLTATKIEDIMLLRTNYFFSKN